MEYVKSLYNKQKNYEKLVEQQCTTDSRKRWNAHFNVILCLKSLYYKLENYQKLDEEQYSVDEEKSNFNNWKSSGKSFELNYSAGKM